MGSGAVGPEAFVAVAAHPAAEAMLLSKTAKGMAVTVGVEKPPAESSCAGGRFRFFFPFFFAGTGQLGEVAVSVAYWATVELFDAVTSVGFGIPARQ